MRADLNKMFPTKGDIDSTFHNNIDDIPDGKLSHTTAQNNQMQDPRFPLLYNNAFPNDILHIHQREKVQKLGTTQQWVVCKLFGVEVLGRLDLM